MFFFTLFLPVIFYLLPLPISGQFNPHFKDDRSVIVHLFEWKWLDVARECELFLGPSGVGGIQVSPPNENSVIGSRPWWERYQPVSYTLTTRSGNEKEFREMISRCRNSGVRVFVDAVINHMSATGGRGTAGSSSDPQGMNYPGVPFTKTDFHTPCQIEDYNDPFQVRNCQLVGLPDLNHTMIWVRDRVTEYLNKLIDCGVAGFRVDAAKHMWPSDLQAIYSRLNNLSTVHGFDEGSRPFIYQEVIDLGGEGVSKYEYTDLGRVTEFRASMEVGRAFRGRNKLSFMDSWGVAWGFMNSSRAVVFVENHDSERGSGDVLTYKDQRPYLMAVAFTLAHPFGVPKVMSSFDFSFSDQGPPADQEGKIISPGFDNNTCGNGWVCQHRREDVLGMISFRNKVGDAPLVNWWSDGNNKIAFEREGLGFIAVNNDEKKEDLNEILTTSLRDGNYCDVITGRFKNGRCTGRIVIVRNGRMRMKIPGDDKWGVVAIHVGERRRRGRKWKAVLMREISNGAFVEFLLVSK